MLKDGLEVNYISIDQGDAKNIGSLSLNYENINGENINITYTLYSIDKYNDKDIRK